MSDPKIVSAAVSTPVIVPAAESLQQQAEFQGREVKLIETGQEVTDNDSSGKVAQWIAAGQDGEQLITKEGYSLKSEFFEEPGDQQPGKLQDRQQQTEASAASKPRQTAASGPTKAASAPSLPLPEINKSLQQAKRGGILSIIKSLVNVIKNLFLPAASQSASASSSTLKNSSLWGNAVSKLQEAFKTFDAAREHVSSPTAELSGKTAELKEALREKGGLHPLKKLIDPAQVMEVLKHKQQALDVLEASPDIPAGKKSRLAKKIQTAAAAISELMETKYSPITTELKSIGPTSFRAFGISGGSNPYLQMSNSGQFSGVQDANVRKWMADGLDILNAASTLIIDSAAGQESKVDAGELKRLLNSFKKDSVQKDFPHADLLRTSGQDEE